MNKNTKGWQNFFNKYLDFDGSGKVDWWEYLIPIVIILTIEIVAELIAYLIIHL